MQGSETGTGTGGAAPGRAGGPGDGQRAPPPRPAVPGRPSARPVTRYRRLQGLGVELGHSLCRGGTHRRSLPVPPPSANAPRLMAGSRGAPCPRLSGGGESGSRTQALQSPAPGPLLSPLPAPVLAGSSFLPTRSGVASPRTRPGAPAGRPPPPVPPHRAGTCCAWANTPPRQTSCAAGAAPPRRDKGPSTGDAWGGGQLPGNPRRRGSALRRGEATPLSPVALPCTERRCTCPLRGVLLWW